MKKVILTGIIALTAILSMNAQNFNVGVTAGLPIGDYDDAYKFNIGLDLSYLWNVSDKFDAGIASGYNHSFGDKTTVKKVTIDFADFQYIPVAGAARFKVSDDFTLGADIGWGISVGKGSGGGFYYRPLVGYKVSDNAQITASYRSIRFDDSNFAAINMGVNFRL